MEYSFSAPAGRGSSARVVHPLWGGELTLEPQSSISFREGLAAPCNVVKTVCTGEVGYRRSARAVRRHEQPFHILTFLDRGRITFTHSHETYVLDAPSISITKNSTAYIAHLRPWNGDGVEVYTLRIPDHLIAPYFPRGIVPGKPLDAAQGAGAAALAMMKLMFEHGAAMPQVTLPRMLAALMDLVALSADAGHAHAEPRRAAHDRHFEALERYVDENIADSGLSLTRAAGQLGVSTRYVSSILHDHGVRFRDYIKDRRIGLAKRLLEQLDGNNYTIAEIASLTGFSTASQFSTAFRNATECTPGSYRKMANPAA